MALQEAPAFSRRVYDADELLQAIHHAIRASGVAGSKIAFRGLVRLEQDTPPDLSTEAPFILTIIKRG
jgi:hypothetical protein